MILGEGTPTTQERFQFRLTYPHEKSPTEVGLNSQSKTSIMPT